MPKCNGFTTGLNILKRKRGTVWKIQIVDAQPVNAPFFHHLCSIESGTHSVEYISQHSTRRQPDTNVILMPHAIRSDTAKTHPYRLCNHTVSWHVDCMLTCWLHLLWNQSFSPSPSLSLSVSLCLAHQLIPQFFFICLGMGGASMYLVRLAKGPHVT